MKTPRPDVHGAAQKLHGAALLGSWVLCVHRGKRGARELKKGGVLLRAIAAVQYEWIHQQQAQFTVRRMGQLLAVSRSGY